VSFPAIIYFWLLATLFFLSPAYADEPEFWPTVRQVLHDLKISDRPSLAGLAGSDAPNRGTIWSGVSGYREGFHPSTVHQLLDVLATDPANVILEAAQRDRRVDLGLGRYDIPKSPLLKFIEKMEHERRFPFCTAEQMKSSNGLDLTDGVFRAFMNGNILRRRPKFEDGLEEIAAWIESSTASTQSTSDAIVELRQWFLSHAPPSSMQIKIKVAPPRPVYDFTEALACFAAEVNGRTENPQFDPLGISVTRREYDIFVGLQNQALTGADLRERIGMDAQLFSRFIKQIQETGLVVRRKLLAQSPMFGYALRREGRRLLEIYPAYDAWKTAQSSAEPGRQNQCRMRVAAEHPRASGTENEIEIGDLD
jgi:DNA-binding HxlR family transcriptional regulator